MIELSPDAFYELPADQRGQLLAFWGKARKAVSTSAGFSGEIVFLDNGEGVFPRLTCAKFPRKREELTPAIRANRFLREIKLQAAAHYHPNVHWPFDVKLILGVPIAFFRRWEGDLSDFIENSQWGDLGRLSLIIQLTAGLAHCHGRGLVHQDLKPQNVFVRDLQSSFSLPSTDLWLRPLVADFGSVNLAADVGEFTGSRPYMAPEQWQETELGEWTSVFVLGIMLHEIMSSGFHPIGERSSDWHHRANPGFNRWQKSELWRRWVEKGCPIAQPLPDKDLANLVAACLKPSTAVRPSLREVQLALLDLLQQRSATAAKQVTLFLDVAESQSAPEEWQHLKGRIESLERQINAHYP
ncbi:protein kinase [Hydrogenophaga sp.]|uniref:protein kinase domain-containing protein n=1 Tax=Hydrogenophaga sp. TaxID=1904254 RepID=UPI0027263744|nr:protein kinase [Hydrogenophaga sp.]MDO9507243.1 protein kinase [Hydrogenophaga sp.]